MQEIILYFWCFVLFDVFALEYALLFAFDVVFFTYKLLQVDILVRNHFMVNVQT